MAAAYASGFAFEIFTRGRKRDPDLMAHTMERFGNAWSGFHSGLISFKFLFLLLYVYMVCMYQSVDFTVEVEILF